MTAVSTYFQHLADRTVAIHGLQTVADSRVDLNGLGSCAADRYTDLVSRIAVAPWTWKGTHLCLFAIAATGHQASNGKTGVYLVENAEVIARRLTADECLEFHDLMEQNENAERLSPAFTVGS